MGSRLNNINIAEENKIKYPIWAYLAKVLQNMMKRGVCKLKIEIRFWYYQESVRGHNNTRWVDESLLPKLPIRDHFCLISIVV